MSKELTNRKDIHGNYLKEGDIIAEGILGEEIWDGDGILISRPLGIVRVYSNQRSTAMIPPEETDCYNIEQIRVGKVQMTDKAEEWAKKKLFSEEGFCNIHISRYDGKFYNWDKVEVIGSIYDLGD